MGEAEALLLERSLRFSEQETALEQGWLLEEMERRFGYRLEELARRFDRSVSWVSRRLALVELLPETVQQQVREGNISAHVAMKYLMPADRYEFAPGEEMQHDTSAHEIELGGKKRKVQTASAVLCYSRMLFFQCYPAFQRFDCKVFLTEALRYMGGSTARVMIDNTHVVVLRGAARRAARARRAPIRIPRRRRFWRPPPRSPAMSWR